jgi:hypothetical protein
MFYSYPPNYVVPHLRHLLPNPITQISAYDAEDLFKSLNSHDQ